MPRISTTRLSADAVSADSTESTRDLGELDAGQLARLLTAFRAVDAVQNVEAEPEITVTARTGKFIIRTEGGRLLLYDARDNTAPYREIEPEALYLQLETVASTPAAEAAGSGPGLEPVRRGPRRLGLATVLLVIGVGLTVNALWSVFRNDGTDDAAGIEPLRDPAEAAAQVARLAGTYAMGKDPSDRVIALAPDGSVRFYELGAPDVVLVDRFKLGRDPSRLALSTTSHGVIYTDGTDALVYSGDRFEREPR